jgi:hypothetical protein
MVFYVILPLLLQVSVLACTATGGVSAPKISPRASASFTWQNPFIAYGMTARQQSLIEHALTKLFDKCLATYGLTLPPTATIAVDPVVAATTSSASVAGWLSIQQSQQRGYLPASPTNDQGELQPLDGPWDISFSAPKSEGALFKDLSSTLRGTTSTFDGKPVPRGGCVQWATGALDGQEGDPENRNIASDPGALLLYLDELTLTSTNENNLVNKAISEWRVCMKEADYRYSSPQAAENDPRWMSYASTGISRQGLIAKEKPVAYADARCRYLTRYSSIRATVFTHYADQVLASHSTQIRRYRSELLQIIRNASSLITNGR